MNQSKHATHGHRRTLVLRGCLLLLAALLIGQGPSAQTFTSGSDGSDGALAIAANAGTIVFDPLDTARWGKVLDPDGDGVYHFTTISIGSGSMLVLRADKVNRAPYWLASGAVVISPGGTIDLSGAAGAENSANDREVRRIVAVPGSGGYAGGSGGRQTPSLPATAGEGPGGGSGGYPSGTNGCPSGHVTCGRGGTYGGNRFLIPLIGGSGGEGGTLIGTIGPNGGAGGGAMLIASSTSIAMDGQMRAAGGNGAANLVYSGAGSGGGIRVVAPTILGSGTFFVAGGGSGIPALGGGANGWVRLEANQLSGSLVSNPSANTTTRGALGVPATLRPANSLRIAAIDGITIPPNPSGTFSLPDVVINKAGPVDVAIEAKGIPPGTVVTLQIYSETPVDNATVYLTAQGTLVGTLQSATVTVPITFPFGFSRGWVRATWAQ